MKDHSELEKPSCDYQGEDGSCHCDDHCVHQTGKWRDFCGAWELDKEFYGQYPDLKGVKKRWTE